MAPDASFVVLSLISGQAKVRSVKNVVAQFIGQVCLMNRANTK
jgi:hypothetical protein